MELGNCLGRSEIWREEAEFGRVVVRIAGMAAQRRGVYRGWRGRWWRGRKWRNNGGFWRFVSANRGLEYPQMTRISFLRISNTNL